MEVEAVVTRDALALPVVEVEAGAEVMMCHAFARMAVAGEEATAEAMVVAKATDR